MSAKPLRFEGQSDDTFGEYGRTMEDFDNCASGDPIVWEVRSGQEGLLIWGQYGGSQWPPKAPPCWMIGVQQLDEGLPLPDWPMRFDTGDRGYSPVLVIEAPADATLRCLDA